MRGAGGRVGGGGVGGGGGGKGQQQQQNKGGNNRKQSSGVNSSRSSNNSGSNNNNSSSGSSGYNNRKVRTIPHDPIVGGSLSLVEQIDKRVIVWLRDKKTITGQLRSFDSYANVVLENAVERIYVGSSYGDVPIPGWFIVRAENVVLLGEVDETRRDIEVKDMKKVDADIILKLRKVQREKDEERRKVMAEFGDDGLQDELY